jgi:hypothetical protein
MLPWVPAAVRVAVLSWLALLTFRAGGGAPTTIAAVPSLPGSDSSGLPPPQPMPPISEQCRVCHDVVTTFRSMFPCPGMGDQFQSINIDPLHARTDGGFEEQYSLSCAFTGNCDALEGSLQSRCYTMRAAMQMDPARRKAIEQKFAEVCEQQLMCRLSRFLPRRWRSRPRAVLGLCRRRPTYVLDRPSSPLLL